MTQDTSSALAGPGADAQGELTVNGLTAGHFNFYPGPAYRPAGLIVDDDAANGYSIMVELWWTKGAKRPQQVCADTNGANKGRQAQCPVRAPNDAKIRFYIAEAKCKSPIGPCTKRRGHWAGPWDGQMQTQE